MEAGVSGFLGMMVLNSRTYADWKIKMEDLLIANLRLVRAREREQIPIGVLESEWKIQNRKPVAIINQCVDVSILMTQTLAECGINCPGCTRGIMLSTKPL